MIWQMREPKHMEEVFTKGGNEDFRKLMKYQFFIPNDMSSIEGREYPIMEVNILGLITTRYSIGQEIISED